MHSKVDIQVEYIFSFSRLRSASGAVFTMAHLSQEHVQHLYDTFGELKVLDDIVRHRAADVPAVPIIGYPRSEDSVSDYERFTGKDLDGFVNAACIRFLSLGFKAVSVALGPCICNRAMS